MDVAPVRLDFLDEIVTDRFSLLGVSFLEKKCRNNLLENPQRLEK